MAASVPSDMDKQPELDQALNAAEKKVCAHLVDGVVPAQRLNLVAQSHSPGMPDSLFQNEGEVKEETFKYSWDECRRDIPALTSRVRILTWNTLADGLAQHGDFVKVPSKLLDWESRAPVLLRELEESGADVICLQEVNHFDDCFLPGLEKLGYSGRFQPKILSPSARFGYAADGVALFYKASRFEMRGYETLQFVDPNGDNMSQCALLCRLRDLQTGDQMLLATTHLKAKTGADNDATRAIQIKQLLKRIAALADSTVPVVLCGDFNCSPDSDVCAALRTHSLGLADAFAQPVASTSELWVDAESSAGNDSGNGRAGAPEGRAFTTWKFRPGGEKKDTIDYIWYRGLDLVRRRRLPTSEMIGPSALPSRRHPSDHIPVCCELAWPQ
ncbi:CCR4-NOT transcription complex subunit 6 [Klebsormidium nitens]|uniref:CCR4-NOT transcription complex subunit 6 n=1 Tax=Klebsormidium nitens TaxID=105231 RepID=A0A1Y1I591_KLENI|nr:CCR4-NOT transcription complex subunit 6 [Klebsormidium nitens]|eukprot:GAQ84331.1 CCR4-NOT transcription complex subunit 6 [Klebsormidium nitens]